MADRYFATARIPWGKNHLNAGDELVDPAPVEGVSPEGVRLGLFIKSGAVRREKATEKPADKTKEANVYKRRDLVAERPVEPPVEQPARRRRTESDKPNPVGAMTTENTLNVKKSDE